MPVLKRPVTLWGCALFVLIVCARRAYGYIDPGTGSYVLQVVAASFLAAGFVIKAAQKNIVGAVTKRFAKRAADD